MQITRKTSDLRESGIPEEVITTTSCSSILLSNLCFSSYLYFQKTVHHDVVALVTSESSTFQASDPSRNPSDCRWHTIPLPRRGPRGAECNSPTNWWYSRGFRSFSSLPIRWWGPLTPGRSRSVSAFSRRKVGCAHPKRTVPPCTPGRKPLPLGLFEGGGWKEKSCFCIYSPHSHLRLVAYCVVILRLYYSKK